MQFNVNANELTRACERLALEPPLTRTGAVLFHVNAGSIALAADGRFLRIAADLQSGGRALIPLSVIEGMVCILPYFGSRKISVEIAEGRMRVHTTVFHHRNIVILVPAFAPASPIRSKLLAMQLD